MVANRIGTDLVAIHDEGRVIEVSPIAFENPGHSCLIGLTAYSVPKSGPQDAPGSTFGTLQVSQHLGI